MNYGSTDTGVVDALFAIFISLECDTASTVGGAHFFVGTWAFARHQLTPMRESRPFLEFVAAVAVVLDLGV